MFYGLRGSPILLRLRMTSPAVLINVKCDTYYVKRYEADARLTNDVIRSR